MHFHTHTTHIHTHALEMAQGKTENLIILKHSPFQSPIWNLMVQGT